MDTYSATVSFLHMSKTWRRTITEKKVHTLYWVAYVEVLYQIYIQDLKVLEKQISKNTSEISKAPKVLLWTTVPFSSIPDAPHQNKKALWNR